jgi:guanylate kinase
MQEFEELTFSISTTTRAARAGEKNGRDYHFVSATKFDELIKAEAFAEWAPVHGNRYGTTKETIEAARHRGRNLLFDVDYQGAVNLRRAYPDETILCFVLPPSLAELERRIRGRGTESEEQVKLRLANAMQELEQFRSFDYLIVNDDLDQAYDSLHAVYVAEGCRQQRRTDLVPSLLAGGQA